ncbi:hypothetical protein TorRG33x02_160080 [Trema orientale]|uniref:Uncharacterized protein n=1 Tax=Trema orientale TaxID=63057 RepID=A0A2P5ERJ8_TREOI|nr:hypothetical protein TorRG33x02_160080 [Trema orientale]
MSHSGNTRLQITPILTPSNIEGCDKSAISKSINVFPPSLGIVDTKLHITLAIEAPVTMKAEKLEAVLRSKPAVIVKIGMKRPPPPTPPALEIEAAMKQRSPARTTGADNLSWGSWDCGW